MPIKFIQHFCKRNELFNKIPIKKDSDLIIDGDALLYYIYIQSQNFTYGGDSEKLYNTAVKFFTLLKQQNVDVFVYMPIDIGDVDEKRNELRIQIFNDLMKQIKDDPQVSLQKTTRGFRFNPNAKQILIQVMREQDIDYQCIEGDVQAYCVQDAIEREVPVLGYDTVYFGHDITFYYIDSIYLDHDRYYKHTQDGVVPEIQCNCASGKSICNKLGLNIKQLQLLLRCLPNDYVSSLQYYRDDLESRVERGSHREGKDGMIFKLAEFIKEYWMEDDDEMIRMLINKEMDAYETVQNNKKETEKQLQKEIDQAQNDLKQLQKQLDPENQQTKQKLEDVQKKIKQLQEQKDNMEQLQQPDKEDLRKQLEESRVIFEQKELTQNQINKHKFNPKWLAKFFKDGRLPTFAYNAYVNKQVIFQPCLEDPESNSIQYSLELRRKLYGFLELNEVVEYTKVGNEFQKQIVKPIKPVKSLDQIITQKLGQEKRAELVIEAIVGEELAFKILKLGTSKEDHHFQFMTAVLVYLICHFESIQAVDLASLTTCAYLRQNPSRVSRSVQQNQLARDFTCLHAISVLQNIIEAACAINNLLGVPLTIKYEKLLQATDVLYQHMQEGRNQTVIGQYHDRLGDEEFVKDLADRLKKDKQSKKLQKCDMQIFEDIDSLKYFNFLFQMLKFKNKFTDYKNPGSDDEEEIEETQSKQKQAESIIAPTKNKFANLMSDD